MATRTLSGFDLRQLWPTKWGASGKLVIALARSVVSEDGVEYPATSNEGGSLDSLGYHWESAITVASSLATCAAISGLVNTDSALPGHQATYNVYVYDVRGKMRVKLNSKPFHLHQSLNSGASSFTWTQWVNANEFIQHTGDLVFIGDRATMQSMVDAVAYQKASDLLIGITRLSAAPAVAADPIAVGKNDYAEVGDTGIVKLSVAPVSATNPIAVSSDTDPRVYQKVIIGTDNAVTDHAALQATITALGVAGGTIRIKGPFRSSGTFTFPVFTTGHLNLELLGVWTLTSKLSLPGGVNLIGIGDVNPGSYQFSPTARIVSPTTAGEPAIYYPPGLNGAKTIKNIHILNPMGPGIRALGASNVYLDRVSVDLRNDPASIGFELDTSFWVWMNFCVVGGQVNSGPSIHLGFTGGGGAIGLIRIKDCIISGHGIKLDATPSAGSATGGNLFIEDLTYENAYDALLDMNMTNFAYYGFVVMKGVGMSDALGSGFAAIKVRHPAGTGPILTSLMIDNYTFAGDTPLLDTDRDIPGLRVGSRINAQTIESRPNSFGLKQRNYIHEAFGRSDHIWDGSGAEMAPSITPYEALATNQDAASWTAYSGSATITTGRLAPDGSSTATRVVEATGTGSNAAYIKFYDAARTISVGDWFIFGIWEKAGSNTTTPFRNTVRLTLDASAPYGQFDDTTNNIANSTPLATATFGSSWKPLVTAAKLTTFSDGATTTKAGVTVGMDIVVYNGSPAELWMPFLIHIPVAAGFSDQDCIRYARHLANVAAGTPAGAVGIFAHQKLYIGSDVNLYRSAADILKTDDKLVAAAGLGVGNSAAATTLGSVTKKIQVFDASGVSLGFIPVYDAIT